MDLENPFKQIIGEKLNIVAFVVDYVEFHFNGPIVRAISNPIAFTKEGEIQFPDLGSRDAFCSFIGQKEGIDLKEEVSLEIYFESRNHLVILLDEKNRIAGETLHWTAGYNEPILVF